MLIVPFIYLLIFGVIGMILWFKMLGIMEKKGGSVSYLWNTPKQWMDFYKLIKEEENSGKKRAYQYILWGQILLIPVYIIGMLVIISLTI